MWQRLTLVLILCFLPVTALAEVSVSDTGLTDTGSEVYGELEENTNIGNFVGERIVKPLLAIVGTLFLLLVIYAGLLWMTAGGVAARVEKAKHILVHSVIGLVIIIAAYAVTYFLLEVLTTQNA